MMLLLVLMLCAIISSVNSAELNFFSSSVIVKTYGSTDDKCSGVLQYTTGYVQNACINFNDYSEKNTCNNNIPSNSNYNPSTTCDFSGSSLTVTGWSTKCKYSSSSYGYEIASCESLPPVPSNSGKTNYPSSFIICTNIIHSFF